MIKNLDSYLSYKDNPQELYTSIDQNPFLTDALIENPKFGYRLLIAFPQFDSLSQENVSTLYTLKKEVIEENPEINPASHPFRVLMQEKLMSYKKNSITREKINTRGINSIEWLNYDKEQSFELGQEEEQTPWSDLIGNPFERTVQETLAKYVKTVKEVLSTEKKTLLEKKSPYQKKMLKKD